MNGYQALSGATGVDLVVALYDGALRFLYRAMQSVEEGDVQGRRIAVKRATDIYIYLQTTLRPDVCAKTTKALSDFYAAMFQLTLEASYYESRELFSEVIRCVADVRSAWVIVAQDPKAQLVLPRDLRGKDGTVPVAIQRTEPQQASAGWSA